MEKKLIDYLLSNEAIEEEAHKAWIKAFKNNDPNNDNGIKAEYKAIAEAQLEECKDYMKNRREDICSKIRCIEASLDNSSDGYTHFRAMVLNLVGELEAVIE